MAIQTIKATIQMRHGLEEDFDSDQMTAGEWAVSTDAKYVRMCFSPGIVLRMATYESFEQDMFEIQTILATCQNIQVAVERFEKIAEQHKNDATGFALLSESWAHGDTGIREGEDADNSEYWSNKSKEEANRAKKEADRAEAIVGLEIDSFLSETSINPVQNKVVTKGLNEKPNKMDLKTVAFTGSYNDLANTPSIPPAVSVKGNAESSYRTGNVNITPGNLGFKTAGSSTQPVYFNSSGLPAACSYTLGKSVPSNAVFTDTWRPVQDNLTSDSATDSLSARQGKVLLNNLKDQIVKVTNVAGLSSSSYFEITSSELEYNKYTGHVHLRLTGKTISAVAAGTVFNLGYIPEKYCPSNVVPCVATFALTAAGDMKCILNTASSDPARAIRARALSALTNNYLVYVSADYYIATGIS